jgi:diguanylate cyclase (GGDEF)-like protein
MINFNLDELAAVLTNKLAASFAGQQHGARISHTQVRATSILVGLNSARACQLVMQAAPWLATTSYNAEQEFWRDYANVANSDVASRCIAHIQACHSMDSLALAIVTCEQAQRICEYLLSSSNDSSIEAMFRLRSRNLSLLRLLASTTPGFAQQVLSSFHASTCAEMIELRALNRRLAVPMNENSGSNDGLFSTLVSAAHPALTRDPLTGALRRDVLRIDPFEYFAPEWLSVLPCKWIIYGDVDHLKRINDEHGLLHGDALLQSVTDVMQSIAGDNVIRFGGEEFLILCHGDGPALAEQIRCAIQQTTISLTMSFGVTKAGATVASIRTAEDALAQAKANGRNRVVVG